MKKPKERASFRPPIFWHSDVRWLQVHWLEISHVHKSLRSICFSCQCYHVGSSTGSTIYVYFQFLGPWGGLKCSIARQCKRTEHLGCALKPIPSNRYRLVCHQAFSLLPDGGIYIHASSIEHSNNRSVFVYWAHCQCSKRINPQQWYLQRMTNSFSARYSDTQARVRTRPCTYGNSI